MNLISDIQYSISKNGYIAILALFIIGIISFLGVFLTSHTINQAELQNREIISAKALELSEAGLQKAINELNRNPLYSGEENFSFGGGTISISITNIDAQNKYVESAGTISEGKFNITRKVGAKVKTSTDNVSFFYGAQVGQGGLIMSNNSIVSGSVYSNGSVLGSAGAQVTGDLWVAGAGNLTIQAQNTEYANGLNVGAIPFGQKIGQEFYASATERLAKVSFYIKKRGSPPNATVTIRNSHPSGWPIGTIIAQGTLQSNLVGTDYSWVDVTFDNNPLLIQGTGYWLTLEMPFTSQSRYYTIGFSGNLYDEGIALIYFPPEWVEGDLDFNFKVHSGLSGQTKIDNVIIGGDAHAPLILNSTISGGAYYQTIQNSTAGSYHPNSPDPPLQNFPISAGQIQDWISEAQSGGVIEGDYSPTTSISLGPKKINGNFTFTNNKTLIITGTIYVTGNINFSNNVTILLDSSYGNNSGIIIADGKINLSNGVIVRKINDTGYVMLISQYNQLNDEAIEIGNNISGGIYFAPYGKLKVNNNANITEVSAYQINLANNVAISYEIGLANINFSSGAGASWQIEKGSWSILE